MLEEVIELYHKETDSMIYKWVEIDFYRIYH